MTRPQFLPRFCGNNHSLFGVSMTMAFPEVMDCEKNDEVEQLEESEDAGSEQETQQTSDLAEETHELEADLETDLLVTEVLVEDVDFDEVLSEEERELEEKEEGGDLVEDECEKRRKS